MELDTGAAVSKHTRNTYFPSLGLTPCSLALRTYTAQTIPVLGEAHVQVKYEDQPTKPSNITVICH